MAAALVGHFALEAVHDDVDALVAGVAQQVGRTRAAFPGAAHQHDRIVLGQALLFQAPLHLGNEVVEGFQLVEGAARVPVGHELLELDIRHERVDAFGHAEELGLGAGADVDEQDLALLRLHELVRLLGQQVVLLLGAHLFGNLGRRDGLRASAGGKHGKEGGERQGDEIFHGFAPKARSVMDRQAGHLRARNAGI
jgi:hypothetical protein